MAFVAPSALITLHASEMLQLARLKARLTAPVLVIQGIRLPRSIFLLAGLMLDWCLPAWAQEEAAASGPVGGHGVFARHTLGQGTKPCMGTYYCVAACWANRW